MGQSADRLAQTRAGETTRTNQRRACRIPEPRPAAVSLTTSSWTTITGRIAPAAPVASLPDHEARS